jgi:hypothetical protein
MGHKMNKNKTNGEKTSLYGAIDNTIMKGVNGGVRAWNWATGGTKADLANKMLTIAPIMDSVGWINYSPSFGVFMTGFALCVSHIFQKRNIEIEKQELEALESHAMDMEVEDYKSRAQFDALSWIACGVFWPMGANKRAGTIIPYATQADYCTAFGNVITGGSFYVMRADYMPPRKNVLSRAVDKTMELLRGLQTRPVGVPAFAGRSLGSIRDIKRAESPT